MFTEPNILQFIKKNQECRGYIKSLVSPITSHFYQISRAIRGNHENLTNMSSIDFNLYLFRKYLTYYSIKPSMYTDKYYVRIGPHPGTPLVKI